MSETIARRVVAHGHVQGVFFRDTVRRRADSRDVTGWVANRPDGTVEVWLEGDPGMVESLVELCRRGPRSAHVERLDVTEEQPQGFDRFDVR